ncbi:hypothetical protein E2C01_066566 [Portunus trituberculatus]|uniref:Secreted protein n=1 Tax=Portunus trituberculatus TaxID=210409 RepID=A0A5B7HU63_PORTR|nr:hypothetical protein [Portunus trituberculatus]
MSALAASCRCRRHVLPRCFKAALPMVALLFFPSTHCCCFSLSLHAPVSIEALNINITNTRHATRNAFTDCHETLRRIFPLADNTDGRKEEECFIRLALESRHVLIVVRRGVEI